MTQYKNNESRSLICLDWQIKIFETTPDNRIQYPRKFVAPRTRMPSLYACNLDVLFLNIFNADGVRNQLGFQSEAKIFMRNQCCKRSLFIKVNTNVIFLKKSFCIIYNV